jgi:hypothetical protein
MALAAVTVATWSQPLCLHGIAQNGILLRTMMGRKTMSTVTLNAFSWIRQPGG